MCIVVVVDTHESTMESYFPEAGNLNGRNDMCSDVAGLSRSGYREICLSFPIGEILRTFTISPTTNTTGCHLGFERDYNYHTAFRAFYVIMHKVYYTLVTKIRPKSRRALHKDKPHFC